MSQIPNNLNEAVETLKKSLTTEEFDEIIELSFDEFISNIHSNKAKEIRNSWGLWSLTQTDIAPSPIAKWFKDHGIQHADDMSAIIYKAFWCEVTSNEFNLENEIEFYREYWLKNGLNPDAIIKM